MSAAAAAPSPEELAWLARARALADEGRGRVSPNPLVGAVVARGGRVLGEGFHAGPGLPHAEVAALRAAGDAARGATVVCTLEPCSHHGRTPPCTDALIAAGVARVVVGCRDPLERDRAGGAVTLTAAGVEVAFADGPEEAACRGQNGPFMTWARLGRPEVTLKMATSLDGKIATATGESRWISGPEARALVHRWRAEQDAVAVGSGTALADDPLLTARDLPPGARQPLRVVFDGRAQLRAGSQLARTVSQGPVLVLVGLEAPPGRCATLERAGVEVALVEGRRGERITAGLAELARRGVQSLLVEGGAGLAAAMLGAGVVDRVAWVLAPMLIGGAAAPGAVGEPGVARLADAARLRDVAVERVGEDVLLSGRLRDVPGGA